jgi:hypothetical protein
MNAYLSLEGVAGVTLFLACIAFSLFDIMRKGSIETVHISMISLALMHGLMFPKIVENANAGIFEYGHLIAEMQDYALVHTFAALLAFFGLFAGWSTAPSKAISYSENFFAHLDRRDLIVAFYAMTAIAAISQYLYTKDYGGFIGYLDLNRFVRSGVIENYTSRSAFSFLSPFGGFAIVAFCGFLGTFSLKSPSLLVFVGAMISGVFAFYFTYASAGRLSMLVFASIIALYTILDVKRSRYFIFFAFIFAAPAALLLLYHLSNWLDLKGSDDAWHFALRESSYMYVSFFAQLDGGEHLSLFKEVLLSPAYLLPESITSSWLSSASNENTMLILGADKGQFGITGSIPTDMITFGLMQFHLPGVFMYAFLFGIAIRLLEATATSFALSGISRVFLSYAIIKIGVFGLFYSYPKNIIVGNFAAIACIGATWLISRVRRNLAAIRYQRRV